MNVSINAYCDTATSIVPIVPGTALEALITSEAYGLPPLAEKERATQQGIEVGEQTPQQYMLLNPFTQRIEIVETELADDATVCAVKMGITHADTICGVANSRLEEIQKLGNSSIALGDFDL